MATRQEGDQMRTDAAQGGTNQASDDLNFGSARSDYGSLAYGGRLDAQGLDESDEENLGRGAANQGNGRTNGQAGGMGLNTALILLGGIGLGAALMYMLDPDQGRRRRAVTRDKLVSASNKTGQVIGKRSRDLRNRAQGVIAETGKLLGLRGERNQQGEESTEASGS
ncbi:MAG TPA: hypothetical protein VEV81_06805 [Pyrinomonadaceae bacterium]|nr:hypothetical protein [Pyrinomonadaceae bacterium]